MQSLGELRRRFPMKTMRARKTNDVDLVVSPSVINYPTKYFKFAWKIDLSIDYQWVEDGSSSGILLIQSGFSEIRSKWKKQGMPPDWQTNKDIVKVYVSFSEDEVSSYEQFSRGSKSPIRLGVLNTSDEFRMGIII